VAFFLVKGGEELKDKLEQAKKRIPKELWREARIQALLEGKTVADWVCEAIREKLSKRR